MLGTKLKRYNNILKGLATREEGLKRHILSFVPFMMNFSSQMITFPRSFEKVKVHFQLDRSCHGKIDILYDSYFRGTRYRELLEAVESRE